MRKGIALILFTAYWSSVYHILYRIVLNYADPFVFGTIGWIIAEIILVILLYFSGDWEKFWQQKEHLKTVPNMVNILSIIRA